MDTAQRPPAAKKPPTVRARCGTTPGYQAHMRTGERPCTPCRVAANADRRKSQIVYDAAVRRLREAHDEEFRLLVDEERSKLVAGGAR